ncbi:MAG: hypothetical protein MO847_06010 [Candidatus Protistobacter heckmanni]|nr:hypothetical protein [Candidatus Protistobacter heckmanni]
MSASALTSSDSLLSQTQVGTSPYFSNSTSLYLQQRQNFLGLQTALENNDLKGAQTVYTSLQAVTQRILSAGSSQSGQNAGQNGNGQTGNFNVNRQQTIEYGLRTVGKSLTDNDVQSAQEGLTRLQAALAQTSSQHASFQAVSEASASQILNNTASSLRISQAATEPSLSADNALTYSNPQTAQTLSPPTSYVPQTATASALLSDTGQSFSSPDLSALLQATQRYQSASYSVSLKA